MKIQKSSYRYLYHSTIDLEFNIAEKKEIAAFSQRNNLEYLYFNEEDDYIKGIINILHYHFKNEKNIDFSNLLQGFLHFLIKLKVGKSPAYFDTLLVHDNNLVIRIYDLHQNGKQINHKDILIKKNVY